MALFYLKRQKKKVNIASLGVHSNRLSNGHHISICYILHSNTQIKSILCFVFVFAFYIEYFFIYWFTKNITFFLSFRFIQSIIFYNYLRDTCRQNSIDYAKELHYFVTLKCINNYLWYKYISLKVCVHSISKQISR